MVSFIRQRELLALVADRTDAAAAAVILSHPAADTRVGITATIDTAGRLRLAELDLTLDADQWDAGTAAGVAELLAQASQPAAHPTPEDPGTQPWQAFTDEAGALREQYVRPRRTPEVHDSDDPAPVTSTLPLADEVYQEAGAVTVQDLQLLAPSVPADLEPAVRAADPHLDDDVAAWFDPDCARPKLTLLGPLSVHVRGKDPAEANRHADLVAYLATRHNGATIEEIGDRFNLAAGTVRKYANVVRVLLGDRPDTGEPYLPHGTESGHGRARGTGLYRLDGILVDADLFRRLRVRAQARGAAGHGMEDNATALRLVTGQPFSRMRSDGWLIQGDRIDLHLVSGVLDVAQIVALNALATDDVATAAAAIEIGRQANPYVESNHLDQAALAIATGRRDEARQILHEVLWRPGDELAPEPLSDRTRQILARHSDWLSQAS